MPNTPSTPATVQLSCPVCHHVLTIHGSGVSCENNHQFDRARQGYLNLLPGHKKRSQNPGDDKDMVNARSRFLESGHYHPVADTLVKKAFALTENIEQPIIVDAGCGEGYYTQQLKNAVPKSVVCGFDISKPAVHACSKKHKTIQWLVASVNDIPLVDNQVDLIISVFSRCDWQAFAKILKPGGQILVLGPGPDHLHELREVIYEQVRPYPENKLSKTLPDCFALEETYPLRGLMNIASTETIMDLLAMTPHFWRIKPEQKQKLEMLDRLSCHYDMRMYHIHYSG